ncbi:cell cycle control protein 50A-like [Anneissia japonica]|uniref:cell cycle control protein 50A-like n=1 Tax=Anneissia japonica TaxID=1529436 RepID=UPI0014256157|nr:cell cycle control protein 50A-like [Anneissia japonica]
MAANSAKEDVIVNENMEPTKTKSPTPNSTAHQGIGDEEERKTKKPGDTAFKQQRLPAWQPILTAGTVLPAFFIVGIIFIPLGVGFLVTSNNVKEKILNYTDCEQDNGETCPVFFTNVTELGNTCICKIPFNLTEDYNLIDTLDSSKKTQQGARDTIKYLEREFHRGNSIRKFRYGSVYLATVKNHVTKLLSFKGKKSSSCYNYLKINHHIFIFISDFEGTVKPPNWKTNISEIDNQLKNEDFIVWMRTAALPTFRKLNGRIVHDATSVFDKQLPKGRYTLTINYNYLVSKFEGKKSFVLTTTSWLGGKNNFLGIAYIVTGSTCVMFGALFLLIHIKHGKRGLDLSCPEFEG